MAGTGETWGLPASFTADSAEINISSGYKVLFPLTVSLRLCLQMDGSAARWEDVAILLLGFDWPRAPVRGIDFKHGGCDDVGEKVNR